MTIASQIDQELKKHVNPKNKEGSKKFFKEKVKVFGVGSPITKKIAQKYWLEIKTNSKLEIFKYCEQLLKTGYNEKIKIALNWAYRLKKDYNQADFNIFLSWLKKYISNWGSDDDLCTHSLGYLIFKFPKLQTKIFKLAKSKNRWERRASAVSLIYPIRYNQKILPNVFKTAEILLQDKDDLVQKGYGWMLKETSNNYPKQVLEFVKKYKLKMPRTALRYAIEKYPQNIRKELLKIN